MKTKKIDHNKIKEFEKEKEKEKNRRKLKAVS